MHTMVISDRWSVYIEDDVDKVKFIKTRILDDLLWDKIYYIITFIESIYDMLRVTDTGKSSPHIVYNMWNTMIDPKG